MTEPSTSNEYTPSHFEKKWQDYWQNQKTFAAKDYDKRPKYYVLDMFPYPSGDGLHVGHVEGYTASDIMARYKRMKGFNVLHPMGWDAFGLPAEQYAIKTNTHPRVTTEKNVKNFRKQMDNVGLSFDWDREINTTDPKYYKWTQWIFRKLFEKGLAYQSNEPVNWCPKLGTVLANEEVVNGFSEVGGHPVEKRTIRQWVLKITEYAERLLQDLELVDWPESTKEMQRNWIGKSTGAYINFSIQGHKDKKFKVFSTRPDTLFGASFCVLAPEHPLVLEITSASHMDEVKNYIEKAKNKSDLERSATDKEKSGVHIGAFAINPVNDQALPIYIADYVLPNYGSGAIMAVPGHDQRDHDFAKANKLPIIQVLDGAEHDIQEQAFSGDGVLINSQFLDGLNKQEAIEKMSDWLEEKACGKRATTYRLRDWIFSRQRYWGEPFPIAFDKEGNEVLIKEQDLPITLPDLDNYEPKGVIDPPLSEAKDWMELNYEGQDLKRESNIMPQWAGSCWYYLRYLDPHNDTAPWDKAKEKYWMPVDLYIGGVEHANLHLLYARFWHKVLFDIGWVSGPEPFKKLVHQGMILGENGEKMSKSRGNVVNPNDVIAQWGADALRLFEMFMGPLEQVKPWQTQGIAGVHRFLKRVWRLYVNEQGILSEQVQQKTSSKSVQVALAKTIKKVTEDSEALHYNTAISAMMECLNLIYKEKGITLAQAKDFLLLLAPYAPHICEELWQKLGHQDSISLASWPEYDISLTKDTTITLAVMINGKKRGTIDIDKDLSQEQALATAQQQEFVKRNLQGKNLKKTIYVPGRILNLIIGD